jgi:rubredoxin
MFQHIADGLCADKDGKMLQRYFHDVFDQSECESQCAKDPLCGAYSFGYHFCSIFGGARVSHPEVNQWNRFWKLGNLWGDTSSNAKEALGVVAPLPGQQKLVCFKKVEYVPPKVEEVRLGHEIAFGILLAMIICTPCVYLLFWKLRQHDDDEVFIWTCSACQHVYNIETDHVELGLKEFDDLPDTWKCPSCGAAKSKYKQTDGDGNSVVSEGENYQDKSALENLQEMQAITGSEDLPVVSPREGGESNVAMSPAQAIDDDQVSGSGQEEDADRDAAVDEDDSNKKETSPVPTDDGIRDPRGEVGG